MFVCLLFTDDKLGWYQRWENNGWRLVSDRVMKRVDQDPVVYESTLKKELFSHNKVVALFYCFHFISWEFGEILLIPRTSGGREVVRVTRYMFLKPSSSVTLLSLPFSPLISATQAETFQNSLNIFNVNIHHGRNPCFEAYHIVYFESPTSEQSMPPVLRTGDLWSPPYLYPSSRSDQNLL